MPLTFDHLPMAQPAGEQPEEGLSFDHIPVTSAPTPAPASEGLSFDHIPVTNAPVQGRRETTPAHRVSPVPEEVVQNEANVRGGEGSALLMEDFAADDALIDAVMSYAQQYDPEKAESFATRADVLAYWEDRMRWDDSNVVSAGRQLARAVDMRSDGDEAGLAALATMRDRWSRVSDAFDMIGEGDLPAAAEKTLGNLWRGAADPVSWLGGFVGGRFASRAAGIAAGAGIDAMAGAGISVMHQEVDVETGMREHVSAVEAAAAGLVSGAASGGASAVAATIGSAVRRQPAEPTVNMDEITVEEIANAIQAEARRVQSVIDDPKISERDKLAAVVRLNELTADHTDALQTKARTGRPRDDYSFNPEKHRGSEEVVDLLFKSDEINDFYTTQRRGVMPIEEIDAGAFARILGVDETKLPPGSTSAEAVRAAMIKTQVYAERTVDLAKQIAANPEDKTLLAKYQLNRLYYAEARQEYAGLRSEAGRALRILREAVGDRPDGLSFQAMNGLLDTLGGEANVIQHATKLAKVASLDPKQLNKRLLEGLEKPTWGGRFWEFWYNSMLSAATTHMVNISSNKLVAAMTVPETAVAAGISGVRRAFGSKDKGVHVREAQARLVGYMNYWGSSFKAFSRAFITEESNWAGSKLDGDLGRIPQIRSEVTKEGLFSSTSLKKNNQSAYVELGGRAINSAGRLIRVPSRLLQAEDDFFKTWNYGAELHQLATRNALDRGYKPGSKEFAESISGFLAAPPTAAVDQARKMATVYTFTNEPGPFAKAILQIVEHQPMLRFVLPFVRTPANIISFAADRSPAYLLLRRNRDAVKRGGREADMVRARALTGTSLMALGVILANEGLMTGSESFDPGERASERAAGLSPYSIKSGDRWLSIGRFEPAGLLMGIGADFVGVVDKLTAGEVEELGNALIAAISANLISKTWLDGIATVVDIFTDPQKAGNMNWFMMRQAGNVIPNIAAHVTKLNDPVLRDARSIMDSVKSRAGMTEDLLPRLDIFGRPIQYEEPAALTTTEYVPLLSEMNRLINPMYGKTEDQDPAVREYHRLQLNKQPVHRSWNGVKLSPVEFYDRQFLRGQAWLDALQNIVSQENYGNLSDGERKSLMDQALTKASRSADDLVMYLHPRLLERFYRDDLSGTLYPEVRREYGGQ